MALLKALCWALIFIIRIRFPPGTSLATVLNNDQESQTARIKVKVPKMLRLCSIATLHQYLNRTMLSTIPARNQRL